MKKEYFELEEAIMSEINSYIENAENKELVEYIMKSLEGLSYREQKMVILRFGLFDGEARTLEEVAQIMGVTKEQVRECESKCFRKKNYHCTNRRGRRDYFD